MKKLCLLALVMISTTSFAWSFQSDSFCDQFKDAKASFSQLTQQGIVDVDYQAQYTVAQMYEHGCGTNKDLRQAYAWYYSCADFNKDAKAKADELFSSFSKDDKQQALADSMQLSTKMSSYSTNKTAKEHLEAVNSTDAASHPAAVIRNFNQEYNTLQSE